MVATKKANYGRIGGEIAMVWKDGVFVVEAVPVGLDKLAVGAKAERVFMRLLADFTAQGRYVSASPSNTYAPTLFASHPKSEGMTKRALKGAMEMLFDRGRIVTATHGNGVNARKHITAKADQSDAD